MPNLEHESFPLCSHYENEWVLDLDMGPHPLWLLEELLETVVIDSGSRVLDLGCGRGATSVFLARELGVEVWAVDLWIPSEEIEATLRNAGVIDSVHACNADARDLPFADAYFDAIISIDAWEYFGTDDHFLSRLLRVLRPDGWIGVATPAMKRDARELGRIPEHIRSVVGWEALAWHAPGWWKQQWELSGLISNVEAREARSGWDDWLRWSQASATRHGNRSDPVVEMLQKDRGELLTFSLLSGRRDG